ncbi:MAG: cysteine desulfurase family protein [Anaerorhabdus sp.]
MPRKIYLDYASTSPLITEVYDTYIKLLKDEYYNTGALYDSAINLSRMVLKSKDSIAKLFSILPNEIIFTSGATESNNLAIKGLALNSKVKKHLITTQIEHSSVLNVFKRLEKDFGFDVTYLPVDSDGIVVFDDLVKAIRNDTLLVSIMWVNNEVGSIQPIEKIKKWLKKNTDAYFHVDATQAIGKFKTDLKDIDLISLSAHKLGGLKGSGLLIKKQHVNIVSLFDGGKQENGIRPGTCNALVNLMFAKTLRLNIDLIDEKQNYLFKLKEHLVSELKQIDGIKINSPEKSVNSIINFSYLKIPSEIMMNAFNKFGIEVSAHSTCTNRMGTGSRVISAMGDIEAAKTCIRVSISTSTTKDEIDYFIKCLREVIFKYGDL